MIRIRIVMYLLFLAASSAFFTLPQPQPRRPLVSLSQAISSIDEMCLENVAELCLQESCDVEEYEALGNTLLEQRDIHLARAKAIDVMLFKLRGHQGHLSKNPSQVKNLLESLRTTMHMDVSSLATCEVSNNFPSSSPFLPS